MIRPFIIVALLLVALLQLARAENAHDDYVTCMSNPAIPVHVTPRFDTPAYDFSKNIGTIMSIAADTRHTIHEGLTLGLTRYEPVITVQAPMVGITTSRGNGCTYVKEANVTVGYQDVRVYIASEIPQGTCGFNEVMGHEQKHINVNMRILQEYMPRIANEINAYLRVYGVRHENDVNQASAEIKQKLHDIINTVLAEMTQENQRLQQGVDTPAEYARVSASCNGQLRTVVGRFQHQR